MMIAKMKNYFREFKNEKIPSVLGMLLILNTVCLLISNIIAAKTFSVFSINNFMVVLPCAVIVFPITYILSDVFSEVYGYKWSRIASWISFIMNIFMVVIFEIAIGMPGETDLTVLHSTWFLLIASLVAYMIGDLMNDKVFRLMKNRDKEKGLVKRALVSSLVGEFCDSAIYIPLGMVILPRIFMGFSFMTIPQALICVVLQPIIKVLYEVIISPFTVIICNRLKNLNSNDNKE